MSETPQSIKKPLNFSAKRKETSDMSPVMFGKVPPQARELEQAVLGAMLLEKDAVIHVTEFLKPHSFYVYAHELIYQAIFNLFGKSNPVDLLTVTEELKSMGSLEDAGGAHYLMELTNGVTSAANVEYHARIISQKYIQRELIKISSEIIKDSYEDSTDVFELLDKAEKNLFAVADENLSRGYENVGNLLTLAIKQLEGLKDQDDKLTGIPSGFTSLDRITGGWQRSDLIILAARPGMGKTAFVLSIARNAAVDFKKAIAVFSLEMSSMQLVNRLISGEAEISSEKLRKGNLEGWEWEKLTKKVGSLSEAPLFIDDSPGLNIFELRAKCRRLKMQHDIQMIIIDYLQLMSGGMDGKSGGNREQEISTISRGLKGIAKELNIPVIALSQLSRAVETRGGDKKPMLSDLRESGAIEQDADMVIFLYRPEYYGITEDENNNSVRGIGEIIIAKHRNGALDTVQAKFIGQFAKFEDLEPSFIDDSSRGAIPSSAINPEVDNPGFRTMRSKADDMDEEAPF